MRLLRWTMVLGIGVLVQAVSQPALSQQTKDVPAWPRNGVIPPQFVNRYVFYDADTDELVLAYPENLGKPEYAQQHGALVLQRIPANRGASARIMFRVTSVNAKYTYSYEVENQKNAKRDITSWQVVLPEHLDGTITAPVRWRGVAALVFSPVSAVGLALGEPGAEGIFLSWFDEVDNSDIRPGMTMDNFSVVSSLKPGITIAYVVGGLYQQNLPDDLPTQVENQLERGEVFSAWSNSQHVTLVTPRFAPSTPRRLIAQNFETGIDRMINEGQITAAAPAIQEVRQQLRAISTQPTNSTPLVVTQKATTMAEEALLRALLLALN